MAQAQLVTKPITRKRPRSLNNAASVLTSSSSRVDAVSLAAAFQKQEEKREFVYSWIALIMKLGLLLVFSGSFIKLGVASHQRVKRHIELTSILELESQRLKKLNRRFDQLFTIGGNRRFMNEQDHWIAPNSFRVIWR